MSLPRSASATGWTQGQTDSADTYTSSRLNVEVFGGGHAPTVKRPGPPRLPTQADIARFFNGSTSGAHIKISTPDGRTLVEMTGWDMAEPNHKSGNANVLYDRRPTDKPFFQVGATFVSPDDEHYYGLGQNQEGYLDLCGHSVRSWHDYDAPAAPSIGVPFIVTNKGYGLLWDNPSKTTVDFGFNERPRWYSEVGNRVSYFVIAGRHYDKIYSGYRQLTGPTPLLTKASYGFIQCKQRYARTNCSPSPKVTANAICPSTRWLLIGFTTGTWAIYPWTPRNGLTRRA